MSKRVLILAAFLTLWPQVNLAQVAGQRTSAGCIDTTKPDAAVSVEGRLIVAAFSDEYGKERAYLLQLPKPICIDDGGKFANADVAFTEVQVTGINSKSQRNLRQLVGRKVRVSGEGFAAHTRHHHRPMVVVVEKVIRTGR